MASRSVRSTVSERYRAALGGSDPLESMAAAPARLRRLVRGASEAALERRPAPKRWSVKEVVAHLADGEVILGARIRFIAAMDRPPIPGYDQDLFVERLGIERVSTAELVAAFDAARMLTVTLLARLPRRAFARVGMHAERGEESIETLVRMYAGHDRIHEEQIARALAEEKARARAAPSRRRAAAVR